MRNPVTQMPCLRVCLHQVSRESALADGLVLRSPGSCEALEPRGKTSALVNCTPPCQSDVGAHALI